MLFKITDYCGIICLGTRMPPTWQSKYACGLIIIMFWCDTVCHEGHYILKLMHFEPTLWSWRCHSHHRVYTKSFIIIWCYYAWTFCYVKSSFFWMKLICRDSNALDHCFVLTFCFLLYSSDHAFFKIKHAECTCHIYVSFPFMSCIQWNVQN